MAEPKLDDAQINAGLEQMSGPGMAQGVHTRLLGHASGEACLLKCTPHTGGCNRHRGSVRILPGTSSSRKEPDRIAMDEPVAAEQGEGARGQRDIAILKALAAAYLELQARAVDPADLKIDAFADAQATGVDGREAGVVRRVVELRENAPDLIDTEDNR
jgi:hypothetical protein